MRIVRREVLRIGGDLAVEFANTVFSATDPGGTPPSLRRAFAQALALRETTRAMLGAMASRRLLRAEWIAEVNEALAAGVGAPRLIRQDGGWRLGLSPGLAAPPQALAPIARSVADLVVSGRGVEIGKCANPRCVLYFRDRSRTRRRRWCSMAVCGNRMKVAAHVRRHGRRRSA
jgi:predicted RNA-binding Zn ribbon-like protein